MEDSIVYAEVYQILNLIDEKYRKKIPKKFYLFLEQHKNKEHKIVGTDINNMVKHKKLQRGTITILTILTLKYWCENQEQKDEILSLLSENDKKAKEKISDVNRLFENKAKYKTKVEEKKQVL